MKREILFKAKRIDNCEWIEGFLMQSDFIREPFSYKSRYGKRKTLYNQIEVNPKTVCQFTGLLDKNGNKIFEGDKCIFEIKGIGSGNSIIEFENGSFVVNSEGQNGKMPLYHFEEKVHSLEIIGNIHD